MIKCLLKCSDCGMYWNTTIPEGFYYKVVKGKTILFDNTDQKSIQSKCKNCGSSNYKVKRQ